MPRTLTFPAPSMWTCPVCDVVLDQPRCPACQADFTRPDGQTLWRVDHDLHDLCVIRNDVVNRLMTEPSSGPAGRAARPSPPDVPPSRGMTAPSGSHAASGWSTGPGYGAPAQPPHGPATPPAAPTAPGGLPPVGGPGRSGATTTPPPARGRSAAEILVGLGALSLVAAVVVFMAVTWDRLSPSIQGGVLLSLTAVVGTIAVLCRRRGLVATAESLSIVSVTLGLADIQVARFALADSVSPRTVWGVGLAVLAVVAVAGGRAWRLRTMSTAGAAIAFVPAAVLTGVSSTTALAAALLPQLAVAVAIDRCLSEYPLERTVVRVGGFLSAAVATAVALFAGVEGLAADPSVDPLGTASVLGGLVIISILGAMFAGWSRASQSAVLAAAVMPLTMAIFLSAVAFTPTAGWALALGSVTVALFAAGAVEVARLDHARDWSAPAAVMACLVAAGSLVPLAVSALTGMGLLVAGAEKVGSGTGPALDRTVTADLPEWALADGATLAQLGALLVLGVLALRGGRVDEGTSVLGVTIVAGAIAAPVALALPIGAAVAGVLVALVAAASVWATRRQDPIALATGFGLAGAAVVLALPSTLLTVLATVISVGAGAVLAGVATERRLPNASLAVGAALTAALAATFLDALALGAEQAGLVITMTVASIVVSAVAPALEWANRHQARMSALGADLVSAGGFLVATFIAADVSVDAVSGVLAALGLVCAASAFRPERRQAWVAALVAGVVVSWLQAADSGVEAIEAYALPLAIALLVAGIVVRRHDPVSSWTRYGAGLALAVAPTAVVALEGSDVTRMVIAVSAGVALAVWGAAGRLQAPMVIGGTVVAALALRHLGPVAADLPRYVVFAVAGVVLLAVGATFEERRKDLRQARDLFVKLR